MATLEQPPQGRSAHLRSAPLAARVHSCDCSTSQGPRLCILHCPPHPTSSATFSLEVWPLSEPQQPVAQRATGTRSGAVRAAAFQGLRWAVSSVLRSLGPPPRQCPPVLLNLSGSLFPVQWSFLRKQLPRAQVGRVGSLRPRPRGLRFHLGHLPAHQFIYPLNQLSSHSSAHLPF